MGISSLTEASGRSRPSRDRARRALARVVLGCAVLSSGSAMAAEAVAPAVEAKPVEPRPSEALLRARRALLERAKERYEAGRASAQGEEEARQHLEGALDALRLAHQLVPAPWLAFNLAQVQSQLGACAEATALYQRFLASDPAAEARASAERALKLLGPCTEPTPFDLGEGLPPGARPPTVGVLLSEVEGGVAPLSLPDHRPPPAVQASGIGPWPWIFGGLALTSAVVAGVFYGDALDAKRELDRLQVGGPRVAQTRERGETALSTARVLGGFSIGFALAAGASWWLRGQGAGATGSESAAAQLLELPPGASASYSFEF